MAGSASLARRGLFLGSEGSGMAAHGDRCDFARDVAFLYPLHVIMEVIGVPEHDEPRMLKLTQELFGSQDHTGILSNG